MERAVNSGHNDAELVGRASAGDQQAFSTLVERHFSAVFLIAYARLNSREAAEDLAQEVFLRAYLHLDRLTDPARFGPWACRVARNLSEDWRRQNQRASRLLPMVNLEGEAMMNLPDTKGNNPRESAQRAERHETVTRALAELAIDQREIVLLFYVEGLTDRGIAEQFGLHHTTVRYHRLRAAEQLRSDVLRSLGDMAGAIRPGTSAVARAGAIIASAAALPNSSKAALIAHSAASMPSAAALQGSVPGLSVASLQVMKTLGASASLGGMALKGKMIAAAVVAAVGLAGGTYFWSDGTIGRRAATVEFKPAVAKPGQTGPADIQQAQGVVIPAFVGKVTGATPARLILEAPVPMQKFDLKISGRAGKQPSDLESALKITLEQEHGLTFARERREADALVLRALPNSGGLLKAAAKDETRHGFTVEPGRIASRSNTMASLARRLEEQLGKPVIDESGVTGYRQIILEWNKNVRGSLSTSLEQQLGLQIVPARREVEYVIIRSKDGTTSTPAVTLASMVPI